MEPTNELMKSGQRPGPCLCDSIDLSQDFDWSRDACNFCPHKNWTGLDQFLKSWNPRLHTQQKISLRVVASAVCTHVSISDYKNRCPVIFELKTTQKPLPGVFLENQKVPVKWLGFAHFLSTFSSVQKEKMTFWPCFWAIFCSAPWPLKNRFFVILKKNFNIR